MYMKQLKHHFSLITPLLSLFVTALLLTSCREIETYEEMKEKEDASIEAFIADGGVDGRPIKVITEEEFYAQDSTTNAELNEYVLFKHTGVYMQIVRKGEGRAHQRGENRNYLARYIEIGVADRDTMTANLFDARPEQMTIRRTGDTFSGSFTYGRMLATYGKASQQTVYSYYSTSTPTFPEGWLVPFSYITPGRPNDKAAKVRIIAPHDYGTPTAVSLVYATFYEITIMPEP